MDDVPNSRGWAGTDGELNTGGAGASPATFFCCCCCCCCGDMVLNVIDDFVEKRVRKKMHVE
jgi:hypothetical protein